MGEHQPPLPPYPELGNLSLHDAKKMATVSQPQPVPGASMSVPSTTTPHVFSDDELSEIFQIDFGQIFGNLEAGLKSNYKGIQSKKSSSSRPAAPSTVVSTVGGETASSSRVAGGGSFSPLPPPEEFQSSPLMARRQLSQSKSCSAVAQSQQGSTAREIQ